MDSPHKRVLGKMDESYTGGEAPGGRDPISKQHIGHWILSEEERSKGFVRPVRLSYKHVGVRPKHPTRELTPEEKVRFKDCNYVAYEAYPEGGALTGRYWTQKQLDSGCGGSITSMPRPIAETIARQPDFYGGTFCCRCGDYFPIGEAGEFVWLDDESRVGT
jgi:hypothetical protein